MINKNVKPNKEQLQAQLNAIVKEERKLLIEKHYPKFKKLAGKCFKFMNSYGNGTSWPAYTKVIKIAPEDLYVNGNKEVLAHYQGWCFQSCSNNIFTVEKKECGYVHGLGKEITEAEFNAAWNKAMASLDSLA